jgi:hypothetical protein
MYKAFLVDKDLIAKDVHFSDGCKPCHKGNEDGETRESAHQGMTKQPSNDLSVCGKCHDEIVQYYKTSLHDTTAGQQHGVKARFNSKEFAAFNQKVFEKSCRSCHASCGDCHVKSPSIGGISTGLIKGHQFVKRDEGKTCGACHGGRVYPEYTGDYGGTADVHYEKGMLCLDCHKKQELHGDGTSYQGRKEIRERPSCTQCHPRGAEKTDVAKTAHAQHETKLSCYACHSGGDYRNCSDCHLGKGASAKPGFMLGINPRDKKTVTTLRMVPTVRDTFQVAGITMSNYDALSNYWDTAPHNIKKRTDRTRSCKVCHEEHKNFLIKSMLLKNGSQANDDLIFQFKLKP